MSTCLKAHEVGGVTWFCRRKSVHVGECSPFASVSGTFDPQVCGQSAAPGLRCCLPASHRGSHAFAPVVDGADR